MRRTVIPSHLRFIEWPQMLGDANKYWATVGPQFHGGPMVLNASLAKKAFRSSSMFARKFDVALYPDALAAWDRWMAAKLLSRGAATAQPPIASHLLPGDPTLSKGLPPPTEHETDAPLAAPPPEPEEEEEVAPPLSPRGAARSPPGQQAADRPAAAAAGGEGAAVSELATRLPRSGPDQPARWGGAWLAAALGVAAVAAVFCRRRSAQLAQLRAAKVARAFGAQPRSTKIV